MDNDKNLALPKEEKQEIIIVVLIFLTLIYLTFTGVYFQYKKQMEDVRETAKKYADYMQATIKKKWHPPRNAPKATVLVEYTIQRNGEITNISILQSSNNKELDESAVAAVKRTKLPALPDEINKESVTTYFTFYKK